MNKILVVDDSKFMTSLLRNILKNEYEVHLVHSGEEALKIVANLQPELILLDIEMQGISGLDTIKALKNINSVMAIPVMFLTGIYDSETEEEAFRLGAVDYMQKPVKENVLRIRVKNQVDLYMYKKTVEAQLRTDALTGIYNVRYFNEKYQSLVKECKSKNMPLTMALIDIDFFKRVNDTYGHMIGDRVLVEVAAILKKELGKVNGTVFRVGGEELAFFITSFSKQDSIIVANLAREAVLLAQIANENSDVCKFLTVSIGGVTVTDFEDMTREKLFKLADEQLYKSKSNGRNQANWSDYK